MLAEFFFEGTFYILTFEQGIEIESHFLSVSCVLPMMMWPYFQFDSHHNCVMVRPSLLFINDLRVIMDIFYFFPFPLCKSRRIFWPLGYLYVKYLSSGYHVSFSKYVGFAIDEKLSGESGCTPVYHDSTDRLASSSSASERGNIYTCFLGTRRQRQHPKRRRTYSGSNSYNNSIVFQQQTGY